MKMLYRGYLLWTVMDVALEFTGLEKQVSTAKSRGKVALCADRQTRQARTRQRRFVAVQWIFRKVGSSGTCRHGHTTGQDRTRRETGISAFSLYIEGREEEDPGCSLILYPELSRLMEVVMSTRYCRIRQPFPHYNGSRYPTCTAHVLAPEHVRGGDRPI